MFGGASKETLDLLQQSFASLAKSGVTTGISTGLGLVDYNLERPAKLLYPALSPLRNEVPRQGLVGGATGFGLAANWRAIYNINNGNVFPGVSEGNRAAVIQTAERDLSATFKGLGMENFVTFEAEYAAQGFDDPLGLATRTLLQATMVGEESFIIWGNTGLALGVTPTPTVADNGASPAGTFGTTPFVFCVALTPMGQLYAGGLLAATTGAVTNAVQPTFTQNHADTGSDTINGGSAQISAQGSATITTGHSVLATVAGVKGAAAYAWYAGSTTGAANCFLAAITAIPKVVLTGPGNAGNQAANAAGLNADHSTNTLAFDGMTTQVLNSSGWGTGGIFMKMTQLNPAAGGAYYLSNAGGALTSAQQGAIDQLDVMFKWMWDAYRTWPDELWVSAYQALKITNLLLAASPNAFRFDISNLSNIPGGGMVATYINKFDPARRALPIRIHPYMPDSWIWAHTKTLADKYAVGNVGSTWELQTRRDYYSIAWPVTTRKRYYGVYVDEVLKGYGPFADGMLCDVG